jgi:septum formation protein
MTTLILASQSQARAALLRAAGYTFRQIPSSVEEPEPENNVPLERHVLDLAVLKAEAVARRYPRAVVIGADTALILGRRIVGKPGTLAGAERMLGELCGCTHRISSAACVIFPAESRARRRRIVRMVDTARVTLRNWTPLRIRRHVALTRPLSWAGSYAVQDPCSAAIVERIEGDLATVIGLPMGKLDRVLDAVFR